MSDALGATEQLERTRRPRRVSDAAGPAVLDRVAVERADVLAVDVLGIGTALPDRVVTNDDWAATLDTDDAWIRSRTGIVERRFATEGETTGTLALDAARAALTDAGVAATDLTAIVVATTTPDRPMPGVAVEVAAALGTEVPAFDLQAVCAGFVTALRVAAPLAASGPVLVIGAETMSRIIDHADRGTAVLFGDGAGAVVLGAAGAGRVAHPGFGRGGTLGPFDLGSDGAQVGILEIPAGGSLAPASAATVAGNEHTIRMHGPEVYRNAVTRMAASSQAVLDAAGLTADDVDVLVAHQANARILDAVARRLDIPAERCQVSLDRHGNTSAASIPLALADAAAEGRLRPGARVLLTAFGAGLSWASCLLTLGDDR